MIGMGKRVRANLLMAFAGNEDQKTIDIASAIELMHAATLIHDDVLDNSTLRRGRLPLFREIGVSAGILYGDHIFTKAFLLISELMDPVINKEISMAVSELLEGEMLEKKTSGDMSPDTGRYYTIIQKKTGVLFGIASKLGALQGGHEQDFVKKAYSFGIKTGTAYQIVDDLMDYFGTSLGKDRFNDIKGGLVTLPLIYLIERCSPDEMSYIGSVFGKKTADVKELVNLTKLMEEYNVPGDVAKRADELLKEAENSIGKEAYAEISPRFDVLYWVKEQVKYVQISDSGRRVCRS